MENTRMLFHMIMLSSKQLRVENKKADGLAFWKPIKKILQQYDTTTYGSWKKMNQKNYNTIMLLPEKTINGYRKETVNEQNHFLIQTLRLPTESDEITLRKLLQIALNIGQFIGIRDETYSWMYLEKYVKTDTIKNIDKIITKDLMVKILTEVLRFVPTMTFYIDDINEHFQ